MRRGQRLIVNNGSASVCASMTIKVLNTIFVTAVFLVALVSAGHALLTKRDPKGAWGWIAVSLAFPFFGPLLYFFFGINRVETRARKIRRQHVFRFSRNRGPSDAAAFVWSFDAVAPEYRELAHISDTVTRRPIVGGNRIEVLHNGEQAYPVMLKAIDESCRTLFLSTYIFETNRTGRAFVEALGRAVQRGVDVKVIVDGIGELHSLPRVVPILRTNGVKAIRFLPPQLFPPELNINLRNHRKILVADSRIAFTGGMNIGDRHLAGNSDNPNRVTDVHFSFRGSVVAQIETIFLEDWRFVTGERNHLPGSIIPSEDGASLCRAVIEGPNEDIDKLSMILLSAVSSARHRVSIMTPYFIPSRGLLAALQAAALRGVRVEIILPGRNNLPYVHWATRNLLWELLAWDVQIYYQPPPFAHTKLFLIDGSYAHVGSANIDPRSLRLNFELNVEVYDPVFVQGLAAHFECVRERSRPVSLDEVDARPLAERLRDGLAWLVSPYL